MTSDIQRKIFKAASQLSTAVATLAEIQAALSKEASRRNRPDLEGKQDKLDADKAKIEQGLAEAREKAAIAMAAAWTGMAIGIAQGLIQVGAAAAAFGGTAGAADDGDDDDDDEDKDEETVVPGSVKPGPVG